MKSYKDIVLPLRVNHFLHGDKPCVVTVIPNEGKIFSPKKPQKFVMTILKDNKLYFHRISIYSMITFLKKTLDYLLIR